MSGLTDSTILITGGAGFVGSHLAETLSPENNVIVVDDLSTGNLEFVPDTATFHNQDITQPGVLEDLTEDVDVVFHEAAVVSVEQSIDTPQATHETNTDATLELLELARDRDFRVVLASSAAIYGQPPEIPIKEPTRKRPTSPYGLDKLTIDHYARLYHDLYGVEAVALRYFNIYGPRQTGGDYAGVISIFREQAMASDPVTIEGEGTQTRDFIHVSDVVDANIAAAQTDAVGEAFNIGTGTETSIADLAETITELTETDSEITHIDPRPGDIERSVADISKAQDQLGFEPTVELYDGLQTLFTNYDESL